MSYSYEVITTQSDTLAKTTQRANETLDTDDGRKLHSIQYLRVVETPLVKYIAIITFEQAPRNN